MTITRFGYLDHLRCLAILGVVAAHTSQSLGNPSLLGIQDYSLGRFGVQLFFLVSGSTVWLSLESCKKNFKQHWIAFYIKRGFRIIPLFFFFSFTVFMARGFLLPSYYFNPFAGLCPDSINIVPGGWSIWNEIYFYFSLPVYAVMRKRKSTVALLGASLATVAHFVALSHPGGSVLQQTQAADFDYLNVFSQFIFFQVGIEIAARNKSNLIYFFVTFTGTSFIFKVLFFRNFLLTPDFGSGYFNACIAFVLACAYLIIAKANDCLGFQIKNVISYLESIGRSTYTMYVVHFGVISVIPLLRGGLIDQIPLELEVAFVFICTYYLSILIQPITEGIWVSLGNKFLEQVS